MTSDDGAVLLRLRRVKKKTKAAIKASPTTPPTTPPAMGPAFDPDDPEDVLVGSGSPVFEPNAVDGATPVDSGESIAKFNSS